MSAVKPSLERGDIYSALPDHEATVRGGVSIRGEASTEWKEVFRKYQGPAKDTEGAESSPREGRAESLRRQGGEGAGRSGETAARFLQRNTIYVF